VAAGWALVRKPAVGFAGAWFFIILAPSSSFIPLAAQPIAEHRMYLPLAAILALFASFAYQRLGRRLVPVLAVLGLVAGVLTWQRNALYRTELALWTDTVARAPMNPRALGNLGAVLLDQGRPEEAAAVFGRAVAILPNSPEILSNLCNTCAGLGRFSEAIAYGEKALRVAPDNADARINLSRAFYLSGNAAVAIRDFPAALAAYRRAISCDPANVALRNNLANVLLVLGKWDEAIAEYGVVLRARPEDRSVQENLQRAIELKAGR
jgi:tetratricopeptide (TPR) repeat protein